jgi:uncharacterized protein
MQTLKSVFIGPDGLRHGWRFLLFATAIVLIGSFVEEPVIGFLAAKLHVDENVLSAATIMLGDTVDLIAVLLVTFVIASFERRRIDSYGLPIGQAFGALFWNGVLIGLGTIAFVGAAMLVTGGMRIHGIALHGRELITSALLWLVAMLLVGLAEEYIFRGYALQSLWRGAGFWPAALITTALFVGAHMSKPHENVIDLTMLFVLGLLVCLSVRVTGSLWWAVGWHAAFDYGQFFIIGTLNGGQLPVGRLFDATFPGPAWITGGELGTEASLFMIPPVIATYVYLLIFLRGRAARC